MKKINILLYQYFDNNEIRIKNRIVDITNRINKSHCEYDRIDLYMLHNLIIELNTYQTIEKELNQLLKSL